MDALRLLRCATPSASGPVIGVDTVLSCFVILWARSLILPRDRQRGTTRVGTCFHSSAHHCLSCILLLGFFTSSILYHSRCPSYAMPLAPMPSVAARTASPSWRLGREKDREGGGERQRERESERAREREGGGWGGGGG